jgi:hypothetical protein
MKLLVKAIGFMTVLGAASFAFAVDTPFAGTWNEKQ